MEFPFNIQSVVCFNEVFIVDKDLKPHKTDGFGQNRKSLCDVIDKLGAASAIAQHLPGPITTSNKLTFTDQRIYLYAEGRSDSNNSCVIGFIKVGTKKLFLYDHSGAQKEVSPLCVLDFYVHESRQRRGYGKLLFEFMLKQEQINPVHLAVDRPSEKFTGFLAKHYKLRAKIPQVNNYVVFEGFFSRRTDDVVKRSRRTQPPAAGGNDRRISAKRYIDTDSFETSITNSCSTSSRVRSGEVGSNQLTRHTNNPVATTVPNGSQHSLQSVASTGSSNSDELLALSNIPLARPLSREKLVGHYRDSPVAGNSTDQSTEIKINSNSSTNHYAQNVASDSRSHSAQNRAYSRHTSTALPYQYSTTSKSDYHEPVRTRSGQSHGDVLNKHQSAQNRQGQLKVMSASPTKPTVVDRAPDPMEWNSTFHSAGKVRQQNSSWNIFGVPPGYSHIANRYPL